MDTDQDGRRAGVARSRTGGVPMAADGRVPRLHTAVLAQTKCSRHGEPPKPENLLKTKTRERNFSRVEPENILKTQALPENHRDSKTA